MTLSFQCPTCALPLQQHQASQGFYCGNKHHFDRNPQGYWVFTQPQRQKPTGDSRQQIRAKRFLLESGIFEPLVVQLAQIIGEYYQPDMSLLEYECADGFYLRALSALLAQRHDDLLLQWVGVADAENAIFAAAKAQTPGVLCLSTSKVLPFSDNSLDLVTVIDKPLKGKELVRVLKEQGVLLLVTPGPRHLWQLKQYVYSDLTEKSQQVNLPSGLTVKSSHPVRFTLDVTGEQALTLLDMTPYAWRATDKMKNAIRTQHFAALEVDFLLVVTQKTAP